MHKQKNIIQLNTKQTPKNDLYISIGKHITISSVLGELIQLILGYSQLKWSHKNTISGQQRENYETTQ